MIEFKKNGKPKDTNRLCRSCIEECKQYQEVKVLKCPFYGFKSSDSEK